MNIYLVRHGETQWNKEKKLQGQSDIPLNEYGRELARKTADGLIDIPFEAVFSSPLIRAEETAKTIIKDRDIPFFTDNRLMEMCFGVDEGFDIMRAKKDKSVPLYYFLNQPEAYIPPKNGESFPDIYKRSMNFINERIIPLENKYENILIVAHGALNRSILNQIANIPIENFWQIQLLNCCVSKLCCQNGTLKIMEEGRIYY